MSNIYIRFGAEPSATQEVADELKSKGINLVRREPNAVQVQGGATTVQPNFAIYKTYLPAFMKAALTKTRVKTGDGIYAGLHLAKDHTRLPIRFPDLLVNWNVTIAEEVRDEMRGNGWRDTMTKGRPAMVKSNPVPEDARYARSKGCLTTTPSGENSMNINAFRQALIISDILATFLRTNQYAAFKDDEHEDEFNKHLEEHHDDHPEVAAKGVEMETDADDDDDCTIIEHRSFRVNLPEDANTRLIFRDEHQMPSGSGLLFQFVDELCKFDRVTVVETINRYFLGCLGTDEEDAAEGFGEIVRAWGNLHNSDWGNMMSHLYKVLDITMRCQAEMLVMMTAGRYDGCFMRGGGFHITIGGRAYRAYPASEIAAHTPQMDYHGQALWKILSRISFLTDEDRVNAFRTCRSIKKLKEYLGAMALTGGTGTQEAVLKEAKFLAFPEDSILDPTAANITTVLSYIADPAKNLNELPSLHHSLLFSTNRAHIAWSVFGEEAPSFRVPGGKAMNLTSSFKVTSAKLRTEKGPMAHRDVTKVGAVIVPLALALQHLDLTMTTKTILNPFGNQIVNAAASHMNKVFEGTSCDMIVNALRSAAKITVIDEAQNRGSKRKADEDAGGAPKKGRVDYGF